MSIIIYCVFSVCVCYIISFIVLVILLGCGTIDGDDPDSFMLAVPICMLAPFLIPLVLPFYLVNRAGMYIYHHKKEWK